MDNPPPDANQDPHTTGQQPVVNIVSQSVALGPLRRELLPTYQRWINDFAVLRTLGGGFHPKTMERETAWYERAATSEQDVNFTIYERSSWRPIGTTSLMEIDYANRTADFGILIGEAEARGKGYGTETTRLMLDYAFSALGLHSVMLLVFEFNLAGRRAYEKAGFREFGRRRQCRAGGGRLWDIIYMECLSTEFTSPLLARTLAPDTS